MSRHRNIRREDWDDGYDDDDYYDDDYYDDDDYDEIPVVRPAAVTKKKTPPPQADAKPGKKAAAVTPKPAKSPAAQPAKTGAASTTPATTPFVSSSLPTALFPLLSHLVFFVHASTHDETDH